MNTPAEAGAFERIQVMLGINTLELNEATMVAAVQMYLEYLFKENKAPTVKSVKQASGNSYSTTFEVVVERDVLGSQP
jgi:hypothetical protein